MEVGRLPASDSNLFCTFLRIFGFVEKESSERKTKRVFSYKNFADANLSCNCPVVCAPFLHQVAEHEGEAGGGDEGGGGGGVDSGGLSYRGTLIKKRFDVLRPYVGCAECTSAPRRAAQ